MRIERLRLRSRDPNDLVAFYRGALEASRWELGVQFGEERIEIGSCESDPKDAFAPPETGFQHFALVVSDIDEAYARLQGFSGWRPISLQGPERLPAASGGASAFKFRDPDGHPLELLQFPCGAAPPLWRSRAAAAPKRLVQGVDHTAITVRNAEATSAFFANLGFDRKRGQINTGPEQARLDGLANLAAATVAIVSLSAPEGARPGVELLEYRDPVTQTRAARDGSAAATSLVLSGHERATGPARDPDGHRVDYAPRRWSGFRRAV